MTTELEKCVKIAGDLQDQRDALIGRVKSLGQQREAVSYSAHTGDKSAKASLWNPEAISSGRV
jgi:hypothetical protein